MVLWSRGSLVVVLFFVYTLRANGPYFGDRGAGASNNILYIRKGERGRRSERRYSRGATVHKYHIVPLSMGATVHKLGGKYKP